MRVIAGKYKKHSLKTVKSNSTRPTTDKNKENIFNSIGPYFDGGVVLDLFGGSGGLGIEALSRGCDYLYSVDKQYEAFRVIRENLSSLHIENAKVYKMDYKKALEKFKSDGVKFDYIFLDPPYGKKMIDGILSYVTQQNLINDGCMIVVEELKEEEFAVIEHLHMIKKKDYGITAFTIYQWEVEDE